jgi:flagellar hook-length control protein FliK
VPAAPASGGRPASAPATRAATGVATADDARPAATDDDADGPTGTPAAAPARPVGGPPHPDAPTGADHAMRPVEAARPAVAAASRAAQVVPAHHVEIPASDPNVARLGGLVRTMATGDVRTATLTLTPAELGEVRVELRSHDGVVSVHLTAARPEGADALRSASGSLRHELERAGVGLDRVDVGTSGGGHADARGQRGQDTDGGGPDLPPYGAPATPARLPTSLARPTRPRVPRGSEGLDLDL